MDLEAKKKLLRSIPSSLTVVGVKEGEDLHGFTASWVSQISMKPPAIMVGIRNESHSLEMIKNDKVFSINFFTVEHKDLVATFFKPAKSEEGRLAGTSFHIGATGTPLLDKAVGYLECEVKHIADGFGDHTAVIAEVIHAEVKDPDAKVMVLSDTPWHYGG